ncbi:MAG: DNA helicase UvrD [Candidatus Magasanikbacteria bacterium]|nr:DNA helicase UvrD [Candidatus Magasanikbacteria bacterium]
MLEQTLDLHIHSKYSRACSKSLELPNIARACEIRGIDIVATGDFTHPKWFEHMSEELCEFSEGVYILKDKKLEAGSLMRDRVQIKFILGTEIACIKKHKDKTRRIHVLVFAPNLKVAEKFNTTLAERGFNLRADGRPILGMTPQDLLRLMLEIDERMVMIPAHAWTPWFGIFGSKGGYDTLKEAFDDLTPHVRAIETGLSSDPLMNWQLSMLDNITLISNSDAHSPQKLGREANVLQFNAESEITYDEIMRIIQTGDKKKFLYTIEFYPEEGKYHYDGHRDCKFVCAPEETKKLKGICPKCKRQLVIGVQNRVEELADRTVFEAQKIRDTKIPFKSLVPLPEILTDVFECGVSTKRVVTEYNNLITKFGTEFFILLHADLDKIRMVSSDLVAEAISRVRQGKIFVRPGYDGEFGVVKIFSDEDRIVTKPVQVSIDLD